ncbi:MAG TPA: nucleoside phosphorylase [Oligoflexia bacterium]|nr:nucleoside phosphorylase [Oligoflexia bacterium]HMR25676.1 nucleoside phosphorylase [Oligoflexia bacterium]
MSNANHIVSASGKEYHIDCKKGDLAEHIILVGDPARSQKIAALFDNIHFETQHREYHSYTGSLNDIPISVMSTGIGPASMEIAVIEACQVTHAPTFIRCGSSGAILEHIKPGDLIISQASMRMEDTSQFFVPNAFPAVANYEVCKALELQAQKLKLSYHVGITASASGFYGAQGRSVEGLPQPQTYSTQQLAQWKVSNFEMETSTLFTLAHLKGLKAGAICAAFANRSSNTFLDDTARTKAEQDCINVALKTLLDLAQQKIQP